MPSQNISTEVEPVSGNRLNFHELSRTSSAISLCGRIVPSRHNLGALCKPFSVIFLYCRILLPTQIRVGHPRQHPTWALSKHVGVSIDCTSSFVVSI